MELLLLNENWADTTSDIANMAADAVNRIGQCMMRI